MLKQIRQLIITASRIILGAVLNSGSAQAFSYTFIQELENGNVTLPGSFTGSDSGETIKGLHPNCVVCSAGKMPN